MNFEGSVCLNHLTQLRGRILPLDALKIIIQAHRADHDLMVPMTHALGRVETRSRIAAGDELHPLPWGV